MMLAAALYAAFWLCSRANARFITQVDPSVLYDYIIVGSGAGGSPLAARLAEYGHSVLLIDAGEDLSETFEFMVPALNLKASEFPPMTWEYFVHHYPTLELQRRDSKMTYLTPSGQRYVGLNPPPGSEPLGVLYPRTGTLGGCTAHNALITVLPDEEDWDDIAQTTGDSSWSAPLMRDYFKRIERCRYVPHTVVGHGFFGWLTTSVTSLVFVVEDPKLLAMVHAAASAIGQGFSKLVETVEGLAQILFRDLNSGFPNRDRREGLFQIPISTHDGHRSQPVTLVKDVMSSGAKLDILLSTLVTRIILEPPAQRGGKVRAVGVEYVQGRFLYRASPLASRSAPLPPPRRLRAGREVIISAGAFNSPQLLKLSGIGPRNELQRMGIPVLVDLPGVGINLQDRYEISVTSSSPVPFKLTRDCTWLRRRPDPCLDRWLTGITDTSKGAYTSPGLAIAVLKRSSVAEREIPDLFIGGGPANFTGYFLGYDNAATGDARHWTWVVLKAHTRNRAGTVHLRSRDPRDTPIINFNYFQTGTNVNGQAVKDAIALTEGLEWARAATANVNNFLLFDRFHEDQPGPRVASGPPATQWAKDEAWGHHASCTCAIGADNDPFAVLDSRFRVRGVEGLRVVDASSFPKIPGYYIVISIYMISEKAADVISADAGVGPGQGNPGGQGLFSNFFRWFAPASGR